ncbi:MAG: hypothetical protein RJA16_1198, partial [Planctomycetota bacterium]
MKTIDRSFRIKASSLAAMVTAGVFALAGLGCGEGGTGTAPAASETASTAAATPAAPAPAPQFTAMDGSTAKATAAPTKQIAPDLRTDSTQQVQEKPASATSELTASRPTDRTAAATPASQAADARKPGPAFRFEPAVLDMGEMMPDVPKTMAIRLVNITEEPVKVNRAVPSCGCTTLGAPKDPIAPGEFADIEITLKPGVATGVKLSKKVTFDIDGYAP